MPDEMDGDLEALERELAEAWRGSEHAALFRVREKVEAKGASASWRRPSMRSMVASIAIALPLVAGAAIAASILLPGRGQNQPAQVGVSPTPVIRSTETPAPLPSPVPGLVSIHMVTGQLGWGLYGSGARNQGDVVRTTDGGRSWSFENSKGAHINGSAFFLDARRAWVASGNGVSLTVDGGATWATTSLRTAGGPGSPLTLDFVDATHGWLTSPSQPSSQFSDQGVEVWRTLDGGVSWQLAASVSAGFGQTPNASGISGACGKQGGVGFRDTRTGWLTGGCLGAITFYVTHDAGTTWAHQALPTVDGAPPGTICQSGGPCDLLPPTFSSATTGYMRLNDYSSAALGSETVLYRTSNGGTSWSPEKAPISDSEPLFFLDASRGWLSNLGQPAVERSTPSHPAPLPPPSAISVTSNGGQAWSPAGSVPFPVFQLQFQDALTGWAVAFDYGAGHAYSLYKTSDGGRSWTDLQPTFGK